MEKKKKGSSSGKLSSKLHETSSSSLKMLRTGSCSAARSTGRSSTTKSANMIFCEICMDLKHVDDTFKIKACSHVFCSYCISGHVAAKIQDNFPNVLCPNLNCQGVLEPDLCHPILPEDVFERWGSILCESLIAESMKFYCPFKDCSALLVDERASNGTVIRESECPHCWRLFCAQCKVPWHPDVSCAEFQKLKHSEREREDILLMKLAKDKKWQRCVNCGFYVERTAGCILMKCRCNYCFCYYCGGQMSESSHYCANCKR